MVRQHTINDPRYSRGIQIRSKFKKKLFLIIIAIISSLFSLVLGEVTLRLKGFQYLLYPTEVQFGWPDPVTIKDTYRVDSELLWVPKGYDSKISTWRGKQPEIVFMGDSCTEFGRYDDALQKMIEKHVPDTTFTFVNVGVGGWSSYQGLQQLKRDILPMKPRVVMIYYGWNDHWTSFGIEDKEIGKYNLKHSDFLLKISTKVRILQLINKVIFSQKQSTSNINGRRPERVSLSDYASNINQIVQIALKNDIVPVLITAPSSHKKGKEPKYLKNRWMNDIDKLVPVHRKYVQVVRDIAIKEQVPLIDLYAEFYALHEEDVNNFFQMDGIHLTEEGNIKLAEFIYLYFMNHEINYLLIKDK